MPNIKFLIAICFFSLCLTGCKPSPPRWQGYNEGRYTYMSSNFAGVLDNLYVQKGTQVKKGDPLFVLDKQPESEELQQAEADLQSAKDTKNKAEADLKLAQLTYNRNKTLVPKGAIQQSVLDAALDDLIRNKALLDQANSTLTSSQAKVNRSQWALQKKAIIAPKDAFVFDTYFRTGEFVPAGQAVLSLLAPGDIKTIFFVPETELGKIHLNQTVWIQCDGCGNNIKERIIFISPQAEYTPPVIYSNQARAKLVFHIEAVPVNQNDIVKLHPGQPVSVLNENHK